MNQLAFFIGYHGCGKTTLGRWLAQHASWKHLSLGDIARSARKRKLQHDIGLRLQCLLAAHIPGQILADHICRELIREVIRLNESAPVAIDGFPSDASHLALIPEQAQFFYINVPDDVRLQRLKDRSLTSERKWYDGSLSTRDSYLPSVLDAIGGKLITLNGLEPIDLLANTVQASTSKNAGSELQSFGSYKEA